MLKLFKPTIEGRALMHTLHSTNTSRANCSRTTDSTVIMIDIQRTGEHG